MASLHSAISSRSQHFLITDTVQIKQCNFKAAANKRRLQHSNTQLKTYGLESKGLSHGLFAQFSQFTMGITELTPHLSKLIKAFKSYCFLYYFLNVSIHNSESPQPQSPPFQCATSHLWDFIRKRVSATFNVSSKICIRYIIPCPIQTP